MAPRPATPRLEKEPRVERAPAAVEAPRAATPGRGTGAHSSGRMWMDPAWDGSQGSRPGTASVRVRELSWQGLHNPCPQSKGLGSHGGHHREQLVEEHLSPARLQALAQVDDLRMVRVLEMCVDTRENSLGNFGMHLPSLNQLKLNGSRLGSLRDLGTSLGHLQVLWLARCGLTDLDGIGSFPALKELYASYNDVADLSPLCLLERLEVLDLEGNGVENLGQVHYLRLCPRLATLTLEGNPVCLRPAPSPPDKAPPSYNYRAEVRKLIPQLRVLDEVPTTHTDLPTRPKLNQDWLMVKAAIKEGSVLGSLLPRLDRPHGATMQKLDPALSLPETPPWSLSLLVPGGCLPEGLLPEDPAPEDHASNLTHGAGHVLCGNPTKGLRAHRHQGQAWAPPGQLPRHRPDLAPSPFPPGPDPTDSCDVTTAGLLAQRELGLGQLESQQEGAAAPQDPQRAFEEQKHQAGPRTTPSPPSRTSELSRTLGSHLIPSPPKYPMPHSVGRSPPEGSVGRPCRGRRLRALGNVKPSLAGGPGRGESLATVAALGALEVPLGPSPRAQGCPASQPALGPAARAPGLHCLHHLNAVPPAHSHP